MQSMVEDGGRARLIVSGEVDLFTAPELKATLRALVTDMGTTDLTVDLTDATLLDAAGIGALFGTYRLLRAREGTLTILADDPRITEPLELTGLTDFVSLVG